MQVPPVLPIDLTAIVAVVMGISIVLIPVAGLTLRFAIKPAVDAIARSFEHQGLEDTVGILERRLGVLERQVESLETTVGRLAEAVEFQNELQAGRVRSSLPAGEPPANPSAGEPSGRESSGSAT